MTPERWRQVTAIFHAALTREEAERAAFVASRCGNDPALRREVEAMVAAHQNADGFGEPPLFAVGAAAALDPAPPGADRPMNLPPGTKLGAFEVLALVGAGGMGEVYRARDTQLGRDVALKLLPDSFTHDPERLARFRREAQVLAALNHPHIGAIHGLNEADGHQLLVLELVDGRPLAEVIAKGPLPVGEALRVATEITEALEAAHDKGIIHRDLKPANIALTREGNVKVLDFGLAKVVDRGGSVVSPVTSPTITWTTTTGAGVILGTAAYMSPEQAKGQAVDKRTDIWAFGCVLFEMLTGRRAFEGDDAPEVLSRVIDRDPDWSRLPASTPTGVQRLLRRCLQKDVTRRLHDIADARIEIADASDQSATSAPGRTMKWRQLTAAVATGALVGSVIVWRVATARTGQESVPSAPVARFALALPSAEGPAVSEAGDKITALALSADGHYLAYVGGPRRQLFLRPIDGFDSKALAGTEGADNPFFSPDGQWLGFVADRKMKKISLSGGAPFTVCTVVTSVFGANWQADGTIVFAPSAPGHLVPGAGLLRVSAEGGSPTTMTGLRERETEPRWPEVLPDGRAVLYSAAPAGANWSSDGMIYIESLETRERRPLVKGVAPHYLPTGHLVYTRSGTMFAVKFDVARQEVDGKPMPVLDAVYQTDEGGPQLSLSRTGSMVYVPLLPPPNRTIVWVDRGGAEQALGVPARPYRRPRLSPDGSRLAVMIDDDRPDVWIFDLSRGVLSRLTSGWTHASPIWTPDGLWLTFRSGPAGDFNIAWMPADGSRPEKQLLANTHLNTPLSWSPDGHMLVYADVDLAQEGAADFGYIDISWLSLDEPDKRHPFLATKSVEGGAEFSPDGRWLAYVSNESGQNEIYVRPFPGPGEKMQISTDGGAEPVWPRNAHQLFFRNGDGMFAVDVKLTPTFSAGPPHRLFEGAYDKGYWGVFRMYDVTADGRRFLMQKGVGDTSKSAPINIVVNWFEELRRRVPPAR